jgi:hypothetical protein
VSVAVSSKRLEGDMSEKFHDIIFNNFSVREFDRLKRHRKRQHQKNLFSSNVLPSKRMIADHERNDNVHFILLFIKGSSNLVMFLSVVVSGYIRLPPDEC